VAKSGLSTKKQVVAALASAEASYERAPEQFVEEAGEASETSDDGNGALLHDADIRIMQQSLRDMADNDENQKLGFVTYDDIRRLPKLKNETIIAIKAPPGTRLRVPDPDDGMARGQRRYQARPALQHVYYLLLVTYYCSLALYIHM
jgi:hypothetical protein